MNPEIVPDEVMGEKIGRAALTLAKSTIDEFRRASAAAFPDCEKSAAATLASAAFLLASTAIIDIEKNPFHRVTAFDELSQTVLEPLTQGATIEMMVARLNALDAIAVIVADAPNRGIRS